MQQQDLAHLIANRFNRVQRAAWVLRDQADAGSAQRIQPLLRPLGDLGAVQPDFAAFAFAVLRKQANNGLGGGGLAGS